MTAPISTPMPPNPLAITRKIRACEGEAAAQLVLEAYASQQTAAWRAGYETVCAQLQGANDRAESAEKELAELRKLLTEAREALEPGASTGPAHMTTREGRFAWLEKTRPIRAAIDLQLQGERDE